MMISMARRLIDDEYGLVISAELCCVLTIGVLAMVVGLSEVAVAVNTELNDISNAFGALRQTYRFPGFVADEGEVKLKSAFAGTTFIDDVDDCDLNLSCDLVAGSTTTSTSETQ